MQLSFARGFRRFCLEPLRPRGAGRALQTPRARAAARGLVFVLLVGASWGSASGSSPQPGNHVSLSVFPARKSRRPAMNRSRRCRLRSRLTGPGLRPVCFLPAPPAGQKAVHGKRFDGEGRKAEVARQGHLEQLPVLQNRKRVVPLRSGPVVPELPQPPADPACDEQSAETPGLALTQIFQQRRPAALAVDGIEQKGKPDPDHTKEVARQPPRQQQG